MKSLIGVTFAAISICVLTGIAMPSEVSAALFNQQDVSKLSDINTSIQSLIQDIDVSTKSVPPEDVKRILSLRYLALTLETVQERLNTIVVLVIISTGSDQFIILNVLYEEMVPKSKDYLNSNRNAILSVATANSADRLYVVYSERAASIIADRALPLLEEFYQKIKSIRRR